MNKMPSGTRRVRCATLRVRQHPNLPENMRHGTREIVDFEVPAAYQNQGYGSTLMHKVCREADAAGMVLMLTPQPWGDNISMSKTQLTEWYMSRFGFQLLQANPIILARMPGATPRLLTLKPTINTTEKLA